MFNYKKAWKEAAAPAFMALPTHILQLVWRVHTEAAYIHHQRNLDLEWASNDLKESFYNLDCEELSYSAHIVNCMGYWHPGYDDWLRPIQRQETYWRYSLYADQILRSKLEIPRAQNAEGFILEVADGLIRATAGLRKQGYYSVKIGLALPETKARAHNIWKDSNVKRSYGNEDEKWIDQAHKAILKMEKELKDPRIINEKDYYE